MLIMFWKLTKAKFQELLFSLASLHEHVLFQEAIIEENCCEAMN